MPPNRRSPQKEAVWHQHHDTKTDLNLLQIASDLFQGGRSCRNHIDLLGTNRSDLYSYLNQAKPTLTPTGNH